MFIKLTSLLDANHTHFTSHNMHYFSRILCARRHGRPRALSTRDPGTLLGVNMARVHHLAGADRPGPATTTLGAPRSRAHAHSTRLWKRVPARNRARRARDAPTAPLSAAATARCARRLAREPGPAAAAVGPACARASRPARAERQLWKRQTGMGRGGLGKKSGDRAGSRDQRAPFGGPVARP